MIRDATLQRDIVMAAVRWLDTPYHHHGRIKDVGVDCAQLVAQVAIEVGVMTPETATGIPDYPTQWHLHNRDEKLLQALEHFGCVEVDKHSVQPGDIVCFQFGRTTSHLGIKIDENRFIHARYDIGRVVINTLHQEWDRKWTKTYAFPGVING